MKVYALSGGYLELDSAIFFADRAPGTRVTAPIGCALVIHPRGRLLFDTGVHCAAIADPVARLGEARAKRFGVRSGPDDHVVAQLALLGLAPDDVSHVANSHLHFDHCGGNEFFPRARFLVQRRELDAARDAATLALGRYTPSARDFDHPLDYHAIDGEHDVFGDGAVVLMPTFGHTPGHQSLRVRPATGDEIVFTADACYTQETMDRDVLPGVLWDAGEMRDSLAALRRLRDGHGARMIYGHDAGQWRAMRRAPEALV
ncbi:MAG: N-acyl homoserine lactonase family protein [Candidatus Rokubacteria bacterium]|nr:N-acyl homoserine lactonase family protein [Candidatus Rokubacteria bacterium]MBI3827249.1 N-acyl homoserine lactonase family protein [Candidatus Rokubacteria bacterium]